MNTEQSKRPSLMRRALRLAARLNPFRFIRKGWLRLRNRLRMRAKIDTIIIALPSQMPLLPETRGFIQRRLFGEADLSFFELRDIFDRISQDPRPKTVILQMRGFDMSLAELQTLRGYIVELRQRGKQVISIAQEYDTASYFIASACNQIVLQPGGELMTIGLAQQVFFLKDALESIGLRFEAVAVSPFKTAFDQLTRSELTPEARQQFEWLLDSRFEIIVNSIAAGRNISPDAVRHMIDHSPMVAPDALNDDYIDYVLNEEGLVPLLNAQHVHTWENAERLLLRRAQKSHTKYIAALTVSGMMVSGESRSAPPLPLPVPIPFIDEDSTGDLDFVQQVRSILDDDNAAAVLLIVDSGGGAALAAEAMASALDELAKTRPIVTYMHSVAASGGYYVAMPGHWIVAQPGTLTGSIGVIGGKLITSEALERFKVRQFELSRGRNAGMFTNGEPLTSEQRQISERMIDYVYEEFLKRVSQSRSLTRDAVDAVGGGRVWTGAQALEHGLVDQLGSIEDALKKLRMLADLPDDTPVYAVEGYNRELPPQFINEMNPAAAVQNTYETMRALFGGAAQMLMPFSIRIKS